MDETKLQEKRRESEEQATRNRGSLLGLRYADSREFEQTLPLLSDILTVDDMYHHKLIPLDFNSESNYYQFAVTSQTPQSVIRDMRTEYESDGRSIDFVLISQSGYKALMLRYDPPKQVVYEDIEIAKDGDSDTFGKVSEILAGVSSHELFDFLLNQADRLGASDIHIENQREHIRVRMRVDGALHSVAKLDTDRYRVILGELASRAGVSSAAREPQSGHMQKEITDQYGTHILNLRVETVPTMYGQDAVMRLFNFDESLLQLDLLGLTDYQRREIDEVVSHPRGLVLMVGPTGSGKSTTLYSLLNALNTADRKLITLEDPIEYSLPGVSQIPIDTTSGQNFADGLRSILRLDPDVVMVGEIRDSDTARTAIQASITGHLVLSSFHATSTSAAFSRMVDMIGVNPIFSSAIRLVIAQRLVRRLVDETKEQYQPDEATRSYVRRVLDGLPGHIDTPDLDSFQLWRPVETAEFPFGYKGRVVIMEQMVVSEEIQKFIRGDVTEINAEAVEHAARAAGMITLEQAGVLAALRGETTLDEVARVV